MKAFQSLEGGTFVVGPVDYDMACVPMLQAARALPRAGVARSLHVPPFSLDTVPGRIAV